MTSKDHLGHCPLHSDSKPSFTLTNARNAWRWYCFPCGAGGTIIDLELRLKGIDPATATKKQKADAIRLLAEEAGISTTHLANDTPLPDHPLEPEPTRFEGTEELVNTYVKGLAQQDFIFSDVGRYLLLSGLGIIGEIGEIAETLKFGYLEKKYFCCGERCASCKEYPALTIPIYCDGELVALKYRNLNAPDSMHKWTQAKGSKADLMWLADLPPADVQSKSVGVFEGISDTALARALGYNSTGILSASFKDTDRFRESVSRIRSTYDHVVLIGDNDEAGRAAMHRLGQFFDDIAVPVPLPGKYKDLSEFYKATDGETVSKWLQSVYEGVTETEAVSQAPAESTNPLFRIPAVYPLEVWEGTDYCTFAEVCGKDNYIPKEFFIESIKTLVGAAAGHLLGVQGTDQEARFYTAFIGIAGCGKSTSMSWAKEILPASLIYTHGNPLWRELGCFMASFASQPGLVQRAKSHRQILHHSDELGALADKFRIAGSGLSFLSLVNQLYEKTLPPSNETKHSGDEVEKPVHFSLLGATTPDKWEVTFGGTGAEGSGFFQRLNIIGSDETRTVPRLIKPDFRQFVPLVEKIKGLREKAFTLPMNPEADAILQEWYDWLKTQTDFDTGRLHVLALRNAAHLGWLLDGVEPQEVIRRAVALSNYQLTMRRKYEPVSGNTAWAMMENLICRDLREKGRMSRRELYKKVHAERAGLLVFNKALELLEREGLIRIEKNDKRSAQWIIWVGA